MKKVILSAITTAVLSGCQSTAVTPTTPIKIDNEMPVTNEQSKPEPIKCIYDELDSPEYKLTGVKYLDQMIHVIPNDSEYGIANYKEFKKNNHGAYSNIINQNFKIYGNQIDNPNHNKYSDDYELESSTGVVKAYDSSKYTQLLTKDCSLYFYQTDHFTNIERLSEKIKRIDNKEISYYEVQKLINPVSSVGDLKLNVDVDDFEGIKWLTTSVIDNTFIRTLISTDTNKILIMQIYKTTSALDWEHLERAVDKDRVKIELTKIGTDVNCSGGNCITYEDIALKINYEYLESHKDTGIVIQAKGTGGKDLIQVPVGMIKIMLDGINASVK